MNRLSKNGAAFIRLHEGFRSRWYKDPTGTGTIGIGFTWASSAFREWWRANKPGVTFGPGVSMTEREADEVLTLLVEREYGKAVNAFLKKDVPQHVFDAMASAVFNLGPGSLKWKWAVAAKAGDYAAAARRLRVTGTTSKGVKLPGLVRRRKEEALLLENGIYTGISEIPSQKPTERVPDKPGSTTTEPTGNASAAKSGGLFAAIARLLAKLFKRNV